MGLTRPSPILGKLSLGDRPAKTSDRTLASTRANGRPPGCVADCLRPFQPGEQVALHPCAILGFWLVLVGDLSGSLRAEGCSRPLLWVGMNHRQQPKYITSCRAAAAAWLVLVSLG